MHPRKDLPERDRLCIFAAAALASAEVGFGAAIFAFRRRTLAWAEEDIECICTESHCELHM